MSQANCPWCQSNSRISALSFIAEPLPQPGNMVRLGARCDECDTWYHHDFHIDSGIEVDALRFGVSNPPADNSTIRVTASLEDESGRALEYDFPFLKAWEEDDDKALFWFREH